MPEASTSIASAVLLLLVGLFCHVFHQLTRATVSIDSIAAIEPCKHLPYLFERVRQVLPGQVQVIAVAAIIMIIIQHMKS